MLSNDVRGVFYKRLIKKIYLLLACLLILAAIMSSLLRAMTPWLKTYRPQIAQFLSDVTQQKVTIEGIETGWHGLSPLIVLNDVRLVQDKKTVLSAQRLALGLSLFESLWHWQPRLGFVYLESAAGAIKQTANGFDVVGLEDLNSKTPSLGFLLAPHKILLNGVSATLLLQNGQKVAIKALHYRLVRHGIHYRLDGQLQLAPYVDRMLLNAVLTHPEKGLQAMKAEVFLTAKGIHSTAIQRLFPQQAFFPAAGDGNVDLWFDWENGQASAQSRIRFKTLKVLIPRTQTRLSFQDLSANLSGFFSKKQFNIQGDNIQWRQGNTTLPLNQFHWQGIPSLTDWTLYIEQIPLSTLPLFSLSLPYVEKVTGTLRDTRIRMHEGLLTDVLSHLSGVNLVAYKHAWAVQNLRGVLHWTPKDGRLQLDSPDLMVKKGTQVMPALQVNGAVNWKEQNDAWRIQLERIWLKRADFALSAHGQWDNVSKGKPMGIVNLVVQTSMQHAERWIPLLPLQYIKPALANWVKRDIYRVGSLDANLQCRGNWPDFPFDNNAGDFTVTARAKGVDLAFGHDWPKTQDIDAYLTLDKRQLIIDLSQGKLQQIPLMAARVQVDDIGHDKEVLAISGEVAGEAEEGIKYILASPLKQRLAYLHYLPLQGPIKLALQLAIPLFGDTHAVKAKGALTLQNDHANVLIGPRVIPIKSLKGTLTFDEQGILAGQLTNTTFDEPLRISLNGIMGNPRKTRMLINSSGKTALTVDSTVALVEKGIDLWIKTLRFGKDAYADLFFRFTSASHDEISVFFKKTQKNKTPLSAQLSYSSTLHQLKGEISEWVIPKTSSEPQKSSMIESLRPQDMPNLALRVRQVRYHDIPLGEVLINGTIKPEGWEINAQCLAKPYEIKAEGVWSITGKTPNTRLKANWHSKDIAGTLSYWGLTPVVEARRGEIEYSGTWPGGFHDFSLKTATGQLNMQLKDGRMTHLSPETEEKLGLGKLLSILSLQTLPRRLKLDFSDLSHKGYSFDELRGHFDLSAGRMHTTDSYLEGPIARIEMKGDLDVVNQDYDLNLTVFPHVTASLPIVATIAGGPVAGIATWLVSKMISRGMQGISSYTYKITGPWQHPVIQQAGMVKKADPKSAR